MTVSVAYTSCIDAPIFKHKCYSPTLFITHFPDQQFSVSSLDQQQQQQHHLQARKFLGCTQTSWIRNSGPGALQMHVDVTSWWLQRQNIVQTGGWEGREICHFTSLGHQQIHSELFRAPLPVNSEQSIWIILPSRFTDSEMIIFWRPFFLKLYYSNILLSLRKSIRMLGQRLEIACGISRYFLRPHYWPYSDLVHLKPFKFSLSIPPLFSVPLAAQFWMLCGFCVGRDIVTTSCGSGIP